MTKIQHPRLKLVRLDVASSKIDDWLAMGWLLIEPHPPADPTPPRAFPTPGDVLSLSLKKSGGPHGQ